MNSAIFAYTQKHLSLMPPRSQNSNKGSFGRVLCICGSVGMSGAAYLAAKAVLRTGAGLAEILTPEENRSILGTLIPEAIITSYDSTTPDMETVDAAIARADAVVCGCGLGISRTSLSILSHLLRTCTAPCVLDADALNLISKNPSLFKYTKSKIITPHPAEMSRLCGRPTSDIVNDLNESCRSFAQRYSLVCLLKGHNTAVSDGEHIYVNNSGNSGMATAGSGDVLAGIIGGILAQNKEGKLTMLEVASLGAYIHGLAGDNAALHVGEYSLIASDIIDFLPSVLKGINHR